MHSEEVVEANTENILHIYSDAAVGEDRVAVVWLSVNDASGGRSLVQGRHFIREAELRAILLVLEQGIDVSTPRLPTDVALRVYSDSQSAVSGYGKHNSCSRPVKINAKAKILGSCGYDVTIL